MKKQALVLGAELVSFLILAFFLAEYLKNEFGYTEKTTFFCFGVAYVLWFYQLYRYLK